MRRRERNTLEVDSSALLVRRHSPLAAVGDDRQCIMLSLSDHCSSRLSATPCRRDLHLDLCKPFAAQLRMRSLLPVCTHADTHSPTS